MKYKFRLSYKEGNKYIPINLNNIDFLSDINKTEIKAIDEFTTHFETKEDMLNYLKLHNLIPTYIDALYVTFDVTKDNKLYEQLCAYNKTLFYKGDKERLNDSYINNYFLNKFENGAFMLSIIEHYERKYPEKKFVTLKSLVRAIKEGGLWSLDPYDRNVYSYEFYNFIDFLFKTEKKNPTTNKKEKKFVYKNIRDFLCFIEGEEPIKVKGNKIYETSFKNYVKSEKILDEYIEPENITLEEYYNFNKRISEPEMFEPYRDGNDYIAPITQEEMKESLNDYAKRLCKKRDNGEYE